MANLGNLNLESDPELDQEDPEVQVERRDSQLS